MFSKSFLSVLIVTSAFTLVFGQSSEASKGSAAQVFSFSFDGDGSYLGVQTTEINGSNFAKFGLREVRGVAIEKVMEDSPAAAAGLQTGDVIVKFNGDEVTGTRKLSRLVSEVAPDHPVKLKIIRGGSEQEMTVTVGKRPIPKFGNGNFEFTAPGASLGKIDMPKMPDMKDFPKGEIPRVFMTPDAGGRNFSWRSGEGRQIGVGVYPLTKQLGEHYGVDSGLMINMVRDDSPAAKAGLKAGDIIVEVDGKGVKNNLDLMKAVNGKKEGEIQLTILRDGNRQTISVTPEASKDAGFFFQTDSEDGFAPMPAPRTIPGEPATPTPMIAPAPMVRIAPMTAPAIMPMLRPGLII